MRMGTIVSLGVLVVVLITLISFGMQSMVAIDTNPELQNSTYYEYYNETTDVYKTTFSLLDFTPMLVVFVMILTAVLWLRKGF